MALIKKPVTGMKDILPAEMEIRDYCISVIKKTYAEFGFQSIETPCVENIANLTSKQGGDNEKLIFKILKRGEKLKLESAQTEADLVDGGLRYAIFPTTRMSSRCLSRPCRWAMSGERTAPRRADTVSSCSAISTSSESPATWRRSS